MSTVSRGQFIRYVDAANREWPALVRSVGPIEVDQPVDLVFLDGSQLTLASVLNSVLQVPSARTAGAPPYWSP